MSENLKVGKKEIGRFIKVMKSKKKIKNSLTNQELDMIKKLIKGMDTDVLMKIYDMVYKEILIRQETGNNF